MKTAPAPAPQALIVIFGIRGDLAKRLLIPALYNLRVAGLVGPKLDILGVDHGAGDACRVRKALGDFLIDQLKPGKRDEAAWSGLSGGIDYLRADFDDADAYAEVAKALKAKGARNVLFYLATSPRFFGPIVEGLGGAGLLKEKKGAFRRVVVEKPFGEDLETARALNRRLLTCLDESQIYRIDHFLGKETVRNIMVTRFGNGVFEPLWNRLHIDSVQITAAETVGVEARGAFYDKTGALRDMTPNHLLSVMAMVAMEPPNSFDPEAVRAEKGRVLEAIRPITAEVAAERSARGQYTAGTVNGRRVVAYRKAKNVDPDSGTETYAALQLGIDNWRWAGVPFYLRTGKALRARNTQVVIQFKAAPQTLFQDLPEGASTPNVLVLQIQPDEGLTLCFDAKKPGPEVELADVAMTFRYADAFAPSPANGYETLIYDALAGDQTLFNRGQDVEAGWRAIMPFIAAWRAGGEAEPYKAGTDGPASADALLARDGRAWRPLA